MRRAALAFGLAVSFAAPASAHVTLDKSEAAAGSYYKANFRVPHGCDGAATTRISIRIPEGVIAIKPQPKPGWVETTRKAKYARAYENHGKAVTEGVVEVTWEGGPLADDRFDEFAFLAKLPGDPEIMALFFPVAQGCTEGTIVWDQFPVPGADPHSLPYPAPSLKLNHGASGHAHH
ncbi:MAG: YcnI family protein [Parvibaculum sp.]|uniref:YcnI family copper-binding membrane protein n=1 Tax=Parvibaculum sp. TaxID=2024848 RepID=UPI002721C4E6|nr:YcnI family protein [Parvibaculum sp.]MDO8838630.1 YcnI family protein [Parvibaculum sp.]